ncbi:hypothetical protein BH18THE2_BH18THE2_07940 [soil metagenome]
MTFDTDEPEQYPPNSKQPSQVADAWTNLLEGYNRAVLAAWDVVIDVGSNWLKAQASMWSPDYFRELYRLNREKRSN